MNHMWWSESLQMTVCDQAVSSRCSHFDVAGPRQHQTKRSGDKLWGRWHSTLWYFLPLVFAFVSINCLSGRNYYCMLLVSGSQYTVTYWMHLRHIPIAHPWDTIHDSSMMQFDSALVVRFYKSLFDIVRDCTTHTYHDAEQINVFIY